MEKLARVYKTDVSSQLLSFCFLTQLEHIYEHILMPTHISPEEGKCRGLPGLAGGLSEPESS